MKNYSKRFLAITLLSSFVFVCGCSEANPIEKTNEEDPATILGEGNADLELLEGRLKIADFYSCLNKYNKERCVNFNKKFGSYDCPELSNPYFDDKGNYTYEPKSSSSEKSSSSAKSSSSSSEQVSYLQENKIFNITLTGFEQLVDSVSADDPIMDPEIRFVISYYSDGVLASTNITPFLLTGMSDVKKWSGENSSILNITKGVDEIHICAEVTDTGEYNTTYNTESDKCVISKKIGLLKYKEIHKESDSSSKVFKVDFEWSLQ